MKTKMFFLLFSFILLLNLYAKAQDSLSYIIIRDAPDGGGNEVTDVSITTDDSLTLYAAGYDAGINYTGDYVAAWTLTGTLDQPGVTDSIFAFSPSSAPTSGSIIATVNNLSNATGTITVSPGSLCEVLFFTEYPDTIFVSVGDIMMLRIIGFDCEDNPIPDIVLDSTDVEIIGTLEVEFKVDSFFHSIFIKFLSTGQGQIILMGRDTSSVIIVQEPDTIAPEYIQIRSAPDGKGVEITSLIMYAGDEITFYAASYDSSDDFIQNQMVEWSATGGLDFVNTTDTAIVFSHTSSSAVGTIIVTTGNLSDTTGLITVLKCGLCYIKIQCNANGLPSENDCFPEYEDTTTVYVGDSLGLFAAAFDCSDNFITNVVLDSIDFEFTGTLKMENWAFADVGQGRIIAKGIDTSGVFIVEEPTSITEDGIIKPGYKLEQAYPNPFNPSTTIKFNLPKAEHVIIEVYNNIGQKVETLINRNMNAGEHEIEFNAENLSSGVYYYRLDAGNFMDVKKFILLR